MEFLPRKLHLRHAHLWRSRFLPSYLMHQALCVVREAQISSQQKERAPSKIFLKKQSCNLEAKFSP